MEAILRLRDDILRLKRLRRAGYLHYGLEDGEHIADHVFGVVFWALLLVDLLRTEGHPVSRDKVLLMAVLHELGEARLGDLHYEARDLLGHDRVQEAERRAVARVLAPLPESLQEEYRALWEEFETGDSLEARVVRLADRLDLLFQSLHYERQGFPLPDIFDHPRTRTAFDEVPGGRELLEAILKERNHGKASETGD